jgi:uncharacterized coiled-coil protein SlyX
VATQSAGELASDPGTTQPKPLALLQRLGRVWRERGAERRARAQRSAALASDPAPARAGHQLRIDALEARMKHLEAALEGLQDALYRQARLGDKRDDELRRRTEPHELVRELGRDARKRGL